MAKRITVMLFGKMVRKGIQIDADATEGATVGKDLRWPDGRVITEQEIRNPSGGTTTTTTPAVVSTLWSLILSIPTIIKNLAALTAVGFIRHQGSGVVLAHDWTFVKNSVDAGETLTIPAARQLIVHGSWTNNGTVINDGELVIL